MMTPPARQEPGKRTVLPDPRTVRYLGAQTQAGHDLLRLIVLLMREQIRQKHFAAYGEINWTRVADYINERIKFPSDMGIRRGRNTRKAVISHDILHEIENRNVRERSIDILEAIALATDNPLTGKPFTVYDLLAVVRQDYTQFEALEEAVKHDLGLDMARGGAIELGRVIREAREAWGWSQQELADRLTKLAVLRTYTVDEVNAIEEPDSDDQAPDLAMLSFLQKLEFVRNPQTGKPYDLALIFLGKLDARTGRLVAE